MWIWMTLALALTPEQADDRIRSIDNLDLEPALLRIVDRPITFSRGAMSVTLNEGVMVPVFSGRFAGQWEDKGSELLRALRATDEAATLPTQEERGSRELVGFVWIDGSGQVDLSLPHDADAMKLASRQVRYAGADVEAMRAVAKKAAPFSAAIDEGVFLSVDPEIEAMFLGDAEADPYDVVVYEQVPSVGRAVRLLDQRLDLWEEMGTDISEMLAIGRVTTEAPMWMVDLHTDTRFARVSSNATDEDRWLSLIHETSMVSGWQSAVFAAGRMPDGTPHAMRVTGVHRPPTDPSDPTSAPDSGAGLRGVNANVRMLVQHPRNGLALNVETTARVTLRADRPVDFVSISVPRVEAKQGSFQWIKAALPDGTPLARPEQIDREDSKVKTTVEVPKPKPKPTGKPWEVQEQKEKEKVTAHIVRLVFPETIQAGEEVQVDLQWTDTWPYANLANTAQGVVSLGKSSGLQRFLPEIDGDLQAPWNYSVSVGLPVESSLSVAVSGPETTEVEGDWRFVRVKDVTNARFANVVVGDYMTDFSPAKAHMPAVHALLLNGDTKQLKGLAKEVRQAIGYFEGYLPPFPVSEYDVVEGPLAYGHFVWVAPHAMMVLQRMRVQQIGASREELARAVFAHEIAHQWWGQMAQPGSLDDRWMIETFAEVFSCMYTAKATMDVDVCVDRHDETRKMSEGPTWFDDVRYSASLSEAFYGGNKNEVVYRYGPYVMQQMLRPRLGNEAFFAGLDQMLREHPMEPVTNERLQSYLEQASGKKLGDFFDFWIHQGILPAVKLEWARQDEELFLEVTSDVAFGTFDIPVVVQGDYRQHVVMVNVVDGVGRATVKGEFRNATKVTLDPSHRTLTRSRSVVKK